MTPEEYAEKLRYLQDAVDSVLAETNHPEKCAILVTVLMNELTVSIERLHNAGMHDVEAKPRELLDALAPISVMFAMGAAKAFMGGSSALGTMDSKP